MWAFFEASEILKPEICFFLASFANLVAHSNFGWLRKPEEFRGFEEFARKLIAVPKKEIDQQKAKYDKKKTSAKLYD